MLRLPTKFWFQVIAGLFGAALACLLLGSFLDIFEPATRNFSEENSRNAELLTDIGTLSKYHLIDPSAETNSIDNSADAAADTVVTAGEMPEPPEQRQRELPCDQLFFQETGEASDYCTDRHEVYYGSVLIPEADAGTFRALSYTPAAGGNDSEWAIDKNHVYYFGELAPDIDASTFTTVFMGVMKDEHRVYFPGYIGGIPCKRSPLCDADPRTFVSLGYYFFKDSQRAYHLYKGKNLSGDDLLKTLPIDLESVAAINADHFEDKSRTYLLGFDANVGYFVSSKEQK